jgi:hypothetical protein
MLTGAEIMETFLQVLNYLIDGLQDQPSQPIHFFEVSSGLAFRCCDGYV